MSLPLYLLARASLTTQPRSIHRLAKMSDRLDDDVLELVLDELSPLTSTGLAYRDVKRTILCLCRTSRRFRLLAQPFLWRQVQVTGPKQLEQLRACSAATGLGRHTVAYEVESPYSHSVNGALAVADVLPNIVKLRVSAAQAPVDVALFAQYHGASTPSEPGGHPGAARLTASFLQRSSTSTCKASFSTGRSLRRRAPSST